MEIQFRPRGLPEGLLQLTGESSIAIVAVRPARGASRKTSACGEMTSLVT